MTVVPSMRIAQQAQADIARITGELADLQRQIATGRSVNDLQTLGDGSTRLISTAGLIRMDENRVRLGQEVEARMRLQASALKQASTSTTQLVRTLREAALNKNGGNLETALQFAFVNLTQSMNETLNGVPLFGGERVGAPPIKATSVDDLVLVANKSDLFDEAERIARVDLGGGLSLDVAEKASDISWDVYVGLRDLRMFLDANPNAVSAEMSEGEAEQILTLAGALETAIGDIRQSESRNGFKLERVEATRLQLQNRVLTLRNELAAQAETDLAAVSTRLATLQTQYQATGQTFAQLSRLSLLEFLR